MEMKILRLSVGEMPVETPTRGAGYSMTDNRKRQGKGWGSNPMMDVGPKLVMIFGLRSADDLD